jgi:hypothetical protein
MFQSLLASSVPELFSVLISHSAITVTTLHAIPFSYFLLLHVSNGVENSIITITRCMRSVGNRVSNIAALFADESPITLDVLPAILP